MTTSATLESTADPKTAGGHGMGVGRLVLYASGGFAFNLYWQSLTLFLLFYYTDVVGISPAVAGLIYLLASFWDGLIDPVIGAAADRTRTRWGGYRPYLLFGAPVLALSFALLYFRPDLEGSALTTFVLATHLLFRTSYAAVNVPYLALSARLTASGAERSNLAGGRMIFASLAGIVVASSTQPIAAAFGRNGFAVAAAVFALAATMVLPIVFLSTRERMPPAATEPPVASKIFWTATLRNRAFWALIAGAVCMTVCSTAWGKSVIYYFKYAIGDAGAAKTGLALAAASGLIFVPLWMTASRFLNKRTLWFAACGFGAIGLSAFALTDVRTPAVMDGFLVFNQIAESGWAFCLWSMLPDTVEYGQLRSGVRAEAFIFGLAGFFAKIAVGLGAGLFGLGLSVIGYHANHPQTHATLTGLKIMMVSIPLAGFVLAALALAFSPMKRGVHDRILADLRAAGSLA
ncbi:MAG TPA: MFS transporter [Phenylobacterium sp.]|jgi:GPH family glycoside/pentoside/hexuronide:cation symporter|uniref:MFS transporter n=1 Tax=Phenylobacterium sp. TaxID=1871053 RepID=UPI002D263368|nr:MFS transporter [Phenylobacterium sp.]HZZ69470.1 MFS transporter [Phenylobacterium sp.]